MLFRNWVELAVVVAIVIIGTMIKWITGWKVKKMDGFKGLNHFGTGRGWKIR